MTGADSAHRRVWERGKFGLLGPTRPTWWMVFDRGRERVQLRSAELVDELVSRVMNEIAEVERLILQRTVEQIEAPLVKVASQEGNSDKSSVSQFGKETYQCLRF